MKTKVRLAILGFLTAFALCIWLLPELSSDAQSPYLQVHFLDVGQGDAIFIETVEGRQILIDGGRDGSVLSELSAVMDFTDRTIDVVIGTHPDTDHIAGLIDVLKLYEVGSIITTENKGDSDAAKLYESLVQTEGAEIIFARRGQTLALGASTTLHVLFPDTDMEEMESNTSSIIVKLEHSDTSFLFTGDAPKNIEEYLVLIEGEYLKSDVLKVGHHGSRTSTSEMFLEEVQPQFAVISSGKDNSYGHPHMEVTDLLFNKRVETLNTADVGTVTFYSDGTKVWHE